jgi:hypothetical protein
VIVPVVAAVCFGYVFWLNSRKTAVAVSAKESEVVGS